MGTTPPSHEIELKAQVAELLRRLGGTEAALVAANAGGRKVGPPAVGDERLERLGAIAHELNNVFAAIIMAVALLRKKVADEKAARLLTVLEENAARGAELVRQVRTLSPADDGVGMPAQSRQAAVETDRVAGAAGGAERRLRKRPRNRRGK